MTISYSVWRYYFAYQKHSPVLRDRVFTGYGFYAPIATLYREARGIDTFQLTLIESISLAVCLLLEIPWGFVADRIGYRKTLLVCNILYFISKIVFWQARGFSVFLAERLILSVYSIIGESVAAITNLAFGKAADSGVANAMLLGAAFCAAALILFILWRFLERKPPAQTAE